MVNQLSEKLERELRELQLLRDDEIDASDIPEVVDWSKAVRGLWMPIDLQHRNYDVRALANEILERAWRKKLQLTNMTLNKLTWFVFEKALLELRQLLTEARAEAWDHGPVFREIYATSKHFEEKPVRELIGVFSRATRRLEPARQEFDEDIDRIIESTIEAYGPLSASKLRALSHRKGSAWYYVWHSGQKTSAGMVISPSIIIAAARARSESNER